MAKGNRGGNGARETRRARRATGAEKGETTGTSAGTAEAVPTSTVDAFGSPGRGAVASATGLPTAGTGTGDKRNQPPQSVSSNNPDRRRELQRESAALGKFPAPEAQKAADKRAQEEAEAQGHTKESKSDGRASKGRAKTLDEVQKDEGKIPAVTATGQIDHATLNHPRSEHEHRVGDATSRVEGPAPRRISEVKNEADVLEQIRLENKADNLYLMRRQERESDEPREFVIQSINARLVEVQGAPILPE